MSQNKKYYWRAKADDGFGSSDWVNDWFRVDVINEAPGIPVLNNPSNNAWVSATTPTLSINASVDPEENKVDYEFEIYKD